MNNETKKIEQVFSQFISEEVAKEFAACGDPVAQQNAVRFFVDLIAALSKKQSRDLRNSASIELAKELMSNPEAKWALETPLLPFGL